MESNNWSQWVGRLFQRHAGVAIAPKTLRSIFITWLRSNTDAPEILKSAEPSWSSLLNAFSSEETFEAPQPIEPS
jgi:hypothetical protein